MKNVEFTCMTYQQRWPLEWQNGCVEEPFFVSFRVPTLLFVSYNKQKVSIKHLICKFSTTTTSYSGYLV